MNKELTAIFSELFSTGSSTSPAVIFDAAMHFNAERTDPAGIAAGINTAFLILLCGQSHPFYQEAENFIARRKESATWRDITSFYEQAIDLIHQEITAVSEQDPVFLEHLHELKEWLVKDRHAHEEDVTAQKIWSVFFPEGTGILNRWQESIDQLRRKRTITVTRRNKSPITDPGKEILFTSNVLLTTCSSTASLDESPLSDGIKQRCLETNREEQAYWYDHPIPIGIPCEKNEVLYGLKGLDKAVEFERSRGNFTGEKITCVLSVSVTHRGLHHIAKAYLEEELQSLGGLKNINVCIITETDSQKIIHEILAPCAQRFCNLREPEDILEIIGVDGEYGRHYSFLKAISAFWSIFIDPAIKATFKIDLDQVFDQEQLVEQTGQSAFDHFMTPLWGAHGLDTSGSPVELGLIAGALVNERDIGTSLFTPDINPPEKRPDMDECIFFSTLPQAMSTRAEMMTRYTGPDPDGKNTCIERVHVTGGTNGILVESLLRYRPFTPSFIGRAEDQAYILSVLGELNERLAYVHKDGLIMRHDKESFAWDAIDAALVGKFIGDYIRILYFSAYAHILSDDISTIKDLVDPFTGSFISKIPVTVVLLRFALKAASFFSRGENSKGLEFIRLGARRIQSALDFTSTAPGALKIQYEKERTAWNLYYDILVRARQALKENDAFALDVHTRAQDIMNGCFLDS
ncbi:MAG TPA: hypothetical protein PLV78_10085 [Deltaproteobacteria bacterium]|nr:hypothetical protein [Deltaproteobacteria bacterium]